MKQTEPIGFKGTPTDWSIKTTTTGKCKIVDTDGFSIVTATSYGHKACCNIQIMAASKKMAIALQKIISEVDITTGGVLRPLTQSEIEEAKEALKEAGL